LVGENRENERFEIELHHCVFFAGSSDNALDLGLQKRCALAMVYFFPRSVGQRKFR